MSEVSLSFGKAVFPTASITVSAFVVALPFARVLASKILDRKRPPHYNPAGRLSIEGGFSTEHLDATDGTVLLLQIQKKNGGRAIADAALFIRARETGPLLSLVAEMPRYHGSLLGNQFSVFQGRGDVLQLSDAEALGLEIPDSYVRGFMDEEEVAECFNIMTISPQLEAVPRYEVVETGGGEKVVIQKDVRVRRMRVRKA